MPDEVHHRTVEPTAAGAGSRAATGDRVADPSPRAGTARRPLARWPVPPGRAGCQAVLRDCRADETGRVLKERLQPEGLDGPG
jgi:hypothetical protein